MQRKEYITKMAELWKKCIQMNKYESIRMKMVYITSGAKNQEELVKWLEEMVEQNLNNEARLEQILTQKLEETKISN